MQYGKNHQLKLGDYYTFDDFNLVPDEIPTISSPSVKTEIIDIPGFSVRYDFTTSLQGSVPFGSREGSWHFHCVGGDEKLRRTIESRIHGKRLTVTVEAGTIDAKTYTGRVYLDEWTNRGGVNSKWAECTISYDLDP